MEKKLQLPFARGLSFGNLVNQKLAFYSGNLIDFCDVKLTRPSILHFPDFSASLLKVTLDDKKVSTVAFNASLDLKPGEVQAINQLFWQSVQHIQLHNNIRISQEGWWGQASCMAEGDN